MVVEYFGLPKNTYFYLLVAGKGNGKFPTFKKACFFSVFFVSNDIYVTFQSLFMLDHYINENIRHTGGGLGMSI